MNDTIVAISTACGASAIGVVRLSGPEAMPVAEAVFRAKGGKRLRELAGYSGALGRVYDTKGDIDEVVAFVYHAPKSYTGEDIVEISCHGGGYILRKVFHMCVENGARPAAPGEFTQRAYLAGKMGLDQAEAVMELISAQGESMARAALSARDGTMSAAVRRIADTLLAQSAHLAAWADYPEEDIEETNAHALMDVLRGAAREIDALLATGRSGRLLREGIATVIVGKPNVGKSTLMNLLSGSGRSIVTDIPGTTRDVVEDMITLGGYVLRLWDTAGLRDTADAVERAGVERARQRLQEADLVLAVFDASGRLDKHDEALLRQLSGKPCVAVLNKNDLPRRAEISRIEEAVSRSVFLSARTGEGKEELEKQVMEALSLHRLDTSAPIVLAERQRGCLAEAKTQVEEAMCALQSGFTMDAVSVCIDCALDALLSLTGERAADAVVNEVFARFCVGK